MVNVRHSDEGSDECELIKPRRWSRMVWRNHLRLRLRMHSQWVSLVRLLCFSGPNISANTTHNVSPAPPLQHHHHLPPKPTFRWPLQPPQVAPPPPAVQEQPSSQATTGSAQSKPRTSINTCKPSPSTSPATQFSTPTPQQANSKSYLANSCN